MSRIRVNGKLWTMGINFLKADTEAENAHGKRVEQARAIVGIVPRSHKKDPMTWVKDQLQATAKWPVSDSGKFVGINKAYSMSVAYIEANGKKKGLPDTVTGPLFFERLRACYNKYIVVKPDNDDSELTKILKAVTALGTRAAKLTVPAERKKVAEAIAEIKLA